MRSTLAGRSTTSRARCLLHPPPSLSRYGSPGELPASLPSTLTCKFLRFQDTVLPDSGSGGLPGGVGLSTAMSELKRLLDLDQGERADPLLEKLKAIADRGRAGAVVTRLKIAPDMSDVTVESALWIRNGDRWAQFGSRTATVRPEDVDAAAGKSLEADPQIQGAVQGRRKPGAGRDPGRTQDKESAHRRSDRKGAGDGPVSIQRRPPGTRFADPGARRRCWNGSERRSASKTIDIEARKLQDSLASNGPMDSGASVLPEEGLPTA